MTVTNHAENLVLDAVLGTDHSSVFPNSVYVALLTADPTDAGTVTEVSSSDTGYARVEVANNDTNFPPASGGFKINGVIIQFPEATAAWGTVTHWGIMDDDTAGNLLFYGELSVPVTPGVGNAPFFSAGTLVIGCD